VSTTMIDVRSLRHPSVPPSWPSAGIVDARAFTIGGNETVHGLTHAAPMLVRGRCGVVARVSREDEPRLAYWADSFPTCSACREAWRHGR
jgi:hypothetical protein